MAEKINAKLGYRPVQPIEEEKEPEAPPAETFKRYEEELEINDFPQTARWKVTSKASSSVDLPRLCLIICSQIPLQCFDAVGWATGRKGIRPVKKSSSAILRGPENRPVKQKPEVVSMNISHEQMSL